MKKILSLLLVLAMLLSLAGCVMLPLDLAPMPPEGDFTESAPTDSESTEPPCRRWTRTAATPPKKTLLCTSIPTASFPPILLQKAKPASWAGTVAVLKSTPRANVSAATVSAIGKVCSPKHREEPTQNAISTPWENPPVALNASYFPTMV